MSSRRPIVVSAVVAVFTLVAGCGGQTAADPDGPGRPSGQLGSDYFYEPTYLPSGFRICGVTDRSELAESAKVDAADPVLRAEDAKERTWVWADLSRPDPWNGPIAEITERKGPDFGPGYSHDGSEGATIKGKPGAIGPRNVFQGVTSDWGYTAMWLHEDGHIVEITPRGSDREAALRMAELVTVTPDGPVLPPNALGSKTGVLYEPDEAEDTIGFYGVELTRPEVGDDPGDSISVSFSEPAHSDEAQYLRANVIASREVDVGGVPGVEFALWEPGKGPHMLIWPIEPGVQATMFTFTAGPEELMKIAEALTPIDVSRLAELRGEASRCSEELYGDEP